MGGASSLVGAVETSNALILQLAAEGTGVRHNLGRYVEYQL